MRLNDKTAQDPKNAETISRVQKKLEMEKEMNPPEMEDQVCFSQWREETADEDKILTYPSHHHCPSQRHTSCNKVHVLRFL